jgi:hypothetical protein
MDGHHFGYKQKFLRKALVGMFIDCALTSSFWVCEKFRNKQNLWFVCWHLKYFKQLVG